MLEQSRVSLRLKKRLFYGDIYDLYIMSINLDLCLLETDSLEKDKNAISKLKTVYYFR